LSEFVRAGEQRTNFGGGDWLEAKGALPPFLCAHIKAHAATRWIKLDAILDKARRHCYKTNYGSAVSQS
jgi:hypothetical protein